MEIPALKGGAARRETAPNSFMHNPAILIEAKNLSNLEFLDLMNASFEILPPCGRQNDKSGQ
jgi:5-methylcytosine-specific restriction endonuclease McrBC regulatory subunit McrC